MAEKNSVRREIIGGALPYEGNDVDTDRIIPARFLRCVTFAELGEQVFWDERFNSDGSMKDHPFNDKRYAGASLLVVNANFGCGSSREHAPQAIMRYGIKAILGESFAEIFAGNCLSLGIPVFTADQTTVKKIQQHIQEKPITQFSCDLEKSTISYEETIIEVEMVSSARNALLDGSWDNLDLLLQNSEKIEEVHLSLPYGNDQV